MKLSLSNHRSPLAGYAESAARVELKQKEILARASKPGTGRGHKNVATNSSPAFSKKRDTKQKDAQSTVGQLYPSDDPRG